MVLGTTIFKMDGNPYYSAPFARRGLTGVFAVSVGNVVGNPTVTITVQHRNSDDITWGDAGVFDPITSTGIKTFQVDGLKQVIRLKFTFAAGDDATDGVHFLMMRPSWRTYAT